MEIGFIGLGHMGAAIVRNLVKAGHELTIYNRTRSKAEPFGRMGATVADSPAEAARHPIVCTMLANDAAIEAILEGEAGLLEAMPPRGIHIGMSTISTALARRLTVAHEAAGQRYVAAPVFGRPDAAEAGKLFVLAAGADAAIAEIDPLLSAIGQKTFRLGTDPAHAAVVKIAGNFMLQSAIEAMAEALALARKQGVDGARFLEVMTGTLFSAPLYKGYGGAMVEGRYEPAGFAITLAVKDTRLAIKAAEEVDLPLPLADLIRDRFLIALSRGWDQLDQAALGRLAAENGGLEAK